MDKKRLLQEIIARLRQDAEILVAAARATREEATHEDNKSESKYDTRGLEASYLAEGQARKAEVAQANLIKFEALPWREFTRGDAIGLGALVEVEMTGFRDLYFCGPGAGGKEIEFEGRECTIVTRESPMGTRLYGAKVGSSFEVSGRPAKIVSVA